MRRSTITLNTSNNSKYSKVGHTGTLSRGARIRSMIRSSYRWVSNTCKKSSLGVKYTGAYVVSRAQGKIHYA